MMNPGSPIHDDELEEVGLDNDPSQLPGVEDYKAQVGFVPQCSRFSYLTGRSHDQLPTLDPCQAKRFPQRSRKPVWRKGYHVPVTLEEYHAQVNYAQHTQSEKHELPSSGYFSIRRVVFIISLLVTLTALIVALSATFKHHNDSPSTIVDDTTNADENDIAPFAMAGFFKNHVAKTGWSEHEVMNDPESPQSRAVDWMVEHDEDLEQLDEKNLMERYGAVTLYFTMGGQDWHPQGTQFLQPSVHICAWYETVHDEQSGFFRMGIDCSCKETQPGNSTSCDIKHPSVQRIILKGMNLTGVVPQEIRLFQDLSELDLNDNKINGPFPAAASQLSQLTRLDLSQNTMNGSVPSWIDKMISLQHLDISSNKFDGEMPSTLANLSRLEFLNAFNNSLEGDIHVFQDMENLKALFVAKNSISGSADHDFLKSLPNLRVLDASENNLTGMFHTLGHPNLAVLDLHGNAIQGEFPDIDPLETRLEYLSLRENNLTGSFPYTMLALSGSLYHLDLAKNLLTGPMPTVVDELVELEYLDLSFNKWDKGDIPSSYKFLKNLRYLALQDTNRRGSLSHELAVNWPKLEILDVGRNNLVGQLPESLSLNPHLRRLVLYHNSFMGNLDLLEEATNLEALIINGGNAWGDLGRLGEFCNGYDFPFLETIVARPCTNDEEDVISPFCPCCVCCPDPKSDKCDSTFWFSSADTAWDTKYVRDHFRTRDANNRPDGL